ncbi:MAG: hypothetical protein U0931_05490 [Vulcanimicrobiota bacterium]
MSQRPDEIWVLAPSGFRPSAWVEMLIDFDQCYDLDAHLIDRRRGDDSDVLVMSTDLLDGQHPLASRHRELLLEMLDKVARMGLIIRPPVGIRERFPSSWDELERICADRKVALEWIT